MLNGPTTTIAISWTTIHTVGKNDGNFAIDPPSPLKKIAMRTSHIN